MAALGAFAAQSDDHRLAKVFIVSLGLHVAGLVFCILSPLLFERKSSKIPVFELVPLEKPRIRVRQPKIQPPPVEEAPTEKPQAPKLAPEPKAAPPPPEVPVEVKREPEPTQPVENVVPEVPEEMVLPHIAMEDLTDQRLKFWIQRVNKIIQTRWSPPSGMAVRGKVEARVEFVVGRDGTIASPKVAGTSGNGDLDGLAVGTIERIERLPPLPPNYTEKDELHVAVRFFYTGN